MNCYCNCRECRSKVRWRYVFAAVLGAWLALWLLGGDRTPEAQEYVTSIPVVITQYHGREMDNGVDFYRIGSAVLSIDRDLPLATYVRAHLGKQVLTLEAR